MGETFDDFILVDEIGIEAGRYGPYLLKTAYRPIFAALPEGLKPFAVEAATAAFCEGAAVEWHAFVAGIAPRERRLIHGLCRILHMRNHRNVHEEDLRLLLDCRPDEGFGLDAVAALIDTAAAQLDDAGLEPEMVICELAGPGIQGDPQAAALLAQAVREAGMCVALDEFGAEQAMPALLESMAPDLVRLDDALFHRMVRVPRGPRLLDTLVSALKDRGIAVLIAGIETPAQLAAALATGADLLQGDLLARPALAGTLLDMRPVDPDSFRRRYGNVVHLIR